MLACSEEVAGDTPMLFVNHANLDFHLYICKALRSFASLYFF